MADTVYNAGDIVGKTLVAKVPVKTYGYPGDNSTPGAAIPAGQTIGVVYSYLDADPSQGRTGIWWMFQTGNGYFYVPHQTGAFDVKVLTDQGVLTTDEKTQAELDANKPWYQHILDSIGSYVPWIIGAIVVTGLVREVIRKKL